MSLLQTARRALEEHDVEDLTVALRAAAAQVMELERQLEGVEHRIPWWDRAVFFHDTVDEERAASLGGELAQASQALAAARQAHHEALRACARACPPIGVVREIERVVDQLLSDRSIARRQGSGDELAEALDSVSRSVLKRWAPGVELSELLEALHDDAARSRVAGRSLPRPRTDPEVGWAPMSADELFTRAAQELDRSGALGAAREELSQANLRSDAMRQHLAQLEANVGFWDELPLSDNTAVRARDSYRKGVRDQVQAGLRAAEVVHHAIVQALSRHPVMWLSLACLGASAALRGVQTRNESMLSPTGLLLVAPSAHGRAVALACLVEARRAAEAAFEGLPAMVWPRRSSPRAPTSSGPGPYRVRGAVASEPIAISKGATAEAKRFFDRLEETGLRQELSWATSHATMSGIIDVCHAEASTKVSWSDHLAFWDLSEEEEAATTFDSRRDWHTALVRHRALGALNVVHHSASQHPLLNLGQHVAVAHHATAAIHTDRGSSRRRITCSIYGGAEAMNAIRAAAARLAERFGCVADRGTQVDAICRLIQESNGRPISRPKRPPENPREVVFLLAHHLQNRGFVELVRQLDEALPSAARATRSANDAAAAVPHFDKLNIFTKSESERRRDQLGRDAGAWQQYVTQLRTQLLGIYREALAHHPPSLLVDGAGDVVSAIEMIRTQCVRRTRTRRVGKTTTTESYYVCKISGVSEAAAQLAAWAQRLVAVVGHIPCSGDLLEQWVASELQ